MAAVAQNQTFAPNCLFRRSSLESSDNLNQLLKIIKRLPDLYKDEHSRKIAEENSISIVDQFKDWPNLLDKKLKTILENCVAIIRMPNTEQGLCHLIFRLIFHIVKIRGYKSVIPMMPHEPADLELILNLLSNEDPMDARAWMTAYMLLLWLSQICMAPCNVTQKDESEMKSVLERIVDAGKVYLRRSTKSQEAAAILLAKFHARVDVVKASMKDLIDWSCEEITRIQNDDMKEDIYLSGILHCLVCLFKFGYREDLLPHAQRVLLLILELDSCPNVCYVILNHRMKLLRNIGLLFLPHHQASWLYKRRLSNIRVNLEQTSQQEWKPSLIFQQMEPQVQDITDVPQEVNKILPDMLKALRIRDSTVRWSTAKGISHLCSFLPCAYVNDVILSLNGLLSVFQRYEGYAAWQGGCLTLSEFARLGVLLPARFGEVLPIVMKALFYEEPGGDNSASTNVRDAACYVCWCLARYYDPVELQDHVTTITNSLIICALFDREVTVRRAASAAFQECIGRQGRFPHGIAILTCLDFLGVSNRQTCYLEHSAFVAQYPEYPVLMADFLIKSRIVCQDPPLRELAAKALNRLAKFCPDYMLKEALPRILTLFNGSDLSAKHGAILAVSEIIIALNRPTDLTQDDMEQLMDITFELEENKIFQGMGGTLMRKACFLLIENASKIAVPFHKHDQGNKLFQNWYELIDESLKQHEDSVQEAACQALSAFLTAYQNTWGCELKNTTCFMTMFTDEAENNLTTATKETKRSGYCRAVGALPAFMLQDPQRLQRLTTAVIASTQSSPATVKWADSRRLAVQALASIAAKAIAVMPVELVLKVGDAMLAIMDYRPADSRGDIGAVVREAGMTCFAELCDVIIQSHRDELEEVFFTKVRVERFVGDVVLHSQERIDRSRKVAGNIFASLLHGREKDIPNFPDLEKVRAIFTKERCEGILWYRSEETFHWFCQLLDLSFYCRPLLLGLMVSSTSTSDLTVRHVTEALQENLARIHRCSVSTTTDVMNTFVDIYEHEDKRERLVIPMMKFLVFLLTKTCIGELLHATDSTFLKKLLHLTKSKVKNSRDVYKITAAIEVYCSLLQFPLIAKPTLSTLMIMLCHPLPVIRKKAAVQIAESLLTYKGILNNDAGKDARIILTTTAWEDSLDVVEPVRDSLCETLDVPLSKKAEQPPS